MILSFTWHDGPISGQPAPHTRCEQLSLTASSSKDMDALSVLARLFTAGATATDVCKRLAEFPGVAVLLAERAEQVATINKQWQRIADQNEILSRSAEPRSAEPRSAERKTDWRLAILTADRESETLNEKGEALMALAKQAEGGDV